MGEKTGCAGVTGEEGLEFVSLRLSDGRADDGRNIRRAEQKRRRWQSSEKGSQTLTAGQASTGIFGEAAGEGDDAVAAAG